MTISINFKKTALSLIIFLALAFGTTAIFSNAVNAQGFHDELCGGANLSLNQGKCPGGNESSLNNLIRAVINILTMIVGIAAVIMILVGGFRFITSGGDSGKVASARQTVIYALVGLAIVALAQVITRYILTKV